MNSKTRNLLAFLLLAVFTAVFAFGQAETGQVNGTVTDPSGAVVSGAKVTLANNGTGQTRTAQTSANGSYAFTNLQPGNYTVTVEGSGFSPYKGNVDVTVGGRHTLDAKLAVGGGGTTTVEVTAEGGAQVNTTDAQISQVVNQTQIQQLPTLNRNPYTLIAITGNVSGDPNNLQGATSRGVGVSINGQRAASTDILLDGGENVDYFVAGVGQTIPLDAVQEFRVVTSNYTAEQGRASGGVVNVATRSGTNSFHGSAYDFNRNSALASNTYQESAQNKFNISQGQPRNPHDRFNRNQFGYSIGGPAVKDKLFFFSSTEWTRVRSNGQQFAFVVDPAFLNITNAGTKSFFQTFGAKLIPSARVVGKLNVAQIPKEKGGTVVFAPSGYTGPVLDQLTYSLPSNAGAGDPQNTYATINRIDLNLTDKTTIWGRYGLFSQNNFNGTNAFSPYDGYNTGSTNYNQNALVNVTHIFSPAVVNQFKTIFNRLNNNQPLDGAPVGPTLYLGRGNTATTISGTGINVALPGYLPFSPGNAIPFGGPQNVYEFSNDLSWTKGTHQLRFGGTYIHIRDNRVFGAYETSVEQLGNNSVVGGLNNLIAGQLFSFQGAVDPKGAFPCATDLSGNTIVTPSCQISLPASQPKFERNNRFNDGAVYAQDAWKTTSRLTLSLGLRWEYYGPQHSADPNVESNFFFGTGATLFDRIRNGFVATTPNSPIHSLWKAKYNNFGPHVGFAYDPFGNGKWSVRGGYSISYERNFGNVTYNVIQNPPNYAVVSLIANTSDTGNQPIPITSSNAGPLAGSGIKKALPKTSLRAVDPDIKTAYAHQFSFAVEHEVVQNTVVALEYSGSRGIHQYGISNINRQGFGNVYIGDGNLKNRLNQQYSNINFRSSTGDTYYNGLNVRLQSSNFRNLGLQLTSNYTWSHAIDDLSSTFSEAGNNFNLGFLDPFNPALDRGNADYDTRHRFVFSAIYEPTFLAFKNSASWVNNLFGGWQFSPIFTTHTGNPFTIYDCSNANLVCPRIFDVAGLQKSGGTNVQVPGKPNLFDYLPIPANSQNTYTDPVVGFSDLPTCLVPGKPRGPCVITPGNNGAGIGRNAFYGPSYWNLDFGINKKFRITERVGLELRGEMFNILNHHNFYVNASNTDFASASTVQTIKGAQGGAGVTAGTSGPNDERRNIQVGAKFTF